MGSQMIQIIILAAIALFLILRLRNVLGTREGYEKPQEMPGPARPARRERPFEVIEGGVGRPRHRRLRRPRDARPARRWRR